MSSESAETSSSHDWQAIRALILAIRPAARLADYPSLADLESMLAEPEIWASTHLWRGNDGRPLAYALVDRFNNLLFDFDPTGTETAVQAQIVEWGVACLRRQPPSASVPLTLDANCREDDADRRAFLLSHGFSQQPIRTLHLKRSLKEPIPDPVLPNGYLIRPLQDSEEGAWVALHRASFGTNHMTLAQRRAMTTRSDYDPALDMVAVAPGGGLAAYCFGWINSEENERTGRREGHTDPVATHPDHQRRGLARALLSAVLGSLYRRDVDSAVLATSSDNVSMQRAAAAVGFRVEYSLLWWSRPV